MTQIILNDAAVLSQFQVLSGVTEVCDAQGRVIGKFLPQAKSPQSPYGIESPYSVEDLNRAEQGEGITLAEFWKTMGRT